MISPAFSRLASRVAPPKFGQARPVPSQTPDTFDARIAQLDASKRITTPQGHAVQTGNWATYDAVITQPGVDMFARNTGDDNFIHVGQPLGQNIAHGLFVFASTVPTAAVKALIGEGTVYAGVESMKFIRPVTVQPQGTQVTSVSEVTEAQFDPLKSRTSFTVKSDIYAGGRLVTTTNNRYILPKK